MSFVLCASEVRLSCVDAGVSDLHLPGSNSSVDPFLCSLSLLCAGLATERVFCCLNYSSTHILVSLVQLLRERQRTIARQNPVSLSWVDWRHWESGDGNNDGRMVDYCLYSCSNHTVISSDISHSSVNESGVTTELSLTWTAWAWVCLSRQCWCPTHSTPPLTLHTPLPDLCPVSSQSGA